MTTRNPITLAIFAGRNKNEFAMDRMEKVYERFGSRIMGGSIVGNPDEEFCIFCKREKVSPVSFNAFLREELGMSGPEIWYCFQKLLNL